MVTAPVTWLEPVSYTHLDVYKRQVNILRLGFGFWSEKNAALHDGGNLCSGQAEPCLGHVEEANETVHGRARRSSRPQGLVFFGNADDKWCMQAGVEKETLASGHHAAVIGVEDDDGVVGESRLLQSQKLDVYKRQDEMTAVAAAPVPPPS